MSVRGYTRFPNYRFKLIVGDHVAKEVGREFASALDFRYAAVQSREAYTQVGNIQFTKGSGNDEKDSMNLIHIPITASGSHTITYSSDFVQYKNDFVGTAGVFDFYFIYLPDGKIAYLVYERQ